MTASLTPETFATAEEWSLSHFLEGAQRRSGSSANLFPAVPAIILFPNIAESTLHGIQKLRPGKFVYLGKEALVGDGLLKHIGNLARHPLNTVAVDLLRHSYSPEVVVHRDMTVRRRAPEEIAAGLTEYLLDYNQENAVKADLALSEEAGAAIGAANPRLVTGVAGSGKTLVLLYRAALNGKLHPEKRSIILTHNKPLIADLRRRLEVLAPGLNAECIHFLSWAKKQLKGNLDILKYYEQEEFIREAAGSISELRAFPISFLREEFEWLKDYDVETLDRYLRAKRIGRGRGLNEAQRCRLFEAFKRYEASLARRGREDWSGLPLRLWKKVQAGRLALPPYDFVYVDEAQFFAPTWLKLIASLVRPNTGQMLLAADPTQGFLKRRESWSASGLRVRGRTIRLQRGYRNTRGIIEHAANFYRKRLPDEDEEINLPDPGQLFSLAEGPAPKYLPVTCGQDEIIGTCTEVRKALAQGARPQDILVITCDAPRVRLLVSRLNKGGLKPIAADAQNEDATGRIRVCSLNAATGLEAPVVLLLGMPQMLEQEQSLGISSEDRHDLCRDNTRKLYMAFTRAADRLIVFSRRSSAS